MEEVDEVINEDSMSNKSDEYTRPLLTIETTKMKSKLME